MYRATLGLGQTPPVDTTMQDTIRTNVIRATLLMLGIGVGSAALGYGVGKMAKAKDPMAWSAAVAAAGPALFFATYVGLNWSAAMQMVQRMQAQQAQLNAAPGATT